MIDNKYQITDILKQTAYKTIKRVKRQIGQCSNYFIMKSYNDKEYFNNQLTIYKLIKQPHLNGFLELRQVLQWNGQYCLVFNQVGESLENYRKKCGGRFTLKTVLMIAIQIIDRIQYVHSLGILHGDIKPVNFLVGLNKQKHKLYLVDFQLAHPYITSSKHISSQKCQKFSGSIQFCSQSSNSRMSMSRKDQIQSFLYSLIYLIKGQLPWIGKGNGTLFQAYEEVGRLKMQTRKEVFTGLPDVFQKLFQANQKIKFQQKPDYQAIKNGFKQLMNKNGYQLDYKYDWEYV